MANRVFQKMNAENPAEFEELARHKAMKLVLNFNKVANKNHVYGDDAQTLAQMIAIALVEIAGKRSIVLPDVSDWISSFKTSSCEQYDWWVEKIKRINKVGDSGERG